MTRDVQLPEPAAALLDAATEVTAGWIRRVVVDAARRGGVDPAPSAADLERVVDEESQRLLARLGALLATDVDEQRTNPLSLYRDAVAVPNELLRSWAVPTPPADAFATSAFPDDPYRLGPATWNDVDERLHEPGLAWGAWKAMTVLRRRRDEGRR